MDNYEDTLKAIHEMLDDCRRMIRAHSKIRALVGATETEDVVSAVEKRIEELIGYNNRMLERARKAEADLRQALEQKCS